MEAEFPIQKWNLMSDRAEYYSYDDCSGDLFSAQPIWYIHLPNLRLNYRGEEYRSVVWTQQYCHLLLL